MDLRIVSALSKVFLDEAPGAEQGIGRVEGFGNENISFQAAWTLTECARVEIVRLEVCAPEALRPYVRVRRVCHVPVRLAAYPDADDDYLRKTPGLYPDRLAEPEATWRAWPGQWESAWIDVDPAGEAAAGVYPLSVRLSDLSGAVLAERSLTVEILPGLLPPQRLIRTQWFHCDGIMRAYGVEFGSEAFFRIVESFVRVAVKRGINMILTPVHTPPLDTAVGGERLTTQLVRVFRRNGVYRFDFSLLDRWVELCQRCGVRYFEMPHLFTQWGARHAPKIVAETENGPERLFGWETAADSPEYREFLKAYLAALTERLRALGIAHRCCFHISDEPSIEALEDYVKAKAAVADALKGFPILDALSDFEFYRTGALERPIPASNRIQPFIDAGVPRLWTYYCCGQYRDVSNMFIAMPAARNRVLGVQLYKFNLEGFLHWGYNFYNCQFSLYPIDPFSVTDADGFVPAGDPFQVYPGRDGAPEESMRLMVTDQAMNDLRALQWLEALAGRDEALRLIEDGLDAPLTFADYPRGEAWLLDLRSRVNRAILRATAR